MRHGRKSKSKRFNGFKRHIAADVDRGLILACAITPANRPEDEAMPSLTIDMERPEVHTDRETFDRPATPLAAVAPTDASPAPPRRGCGDRLHAECRDTRRRRGMLARTSPSRHGRPHEARCASKDGEMGRDPHGVREPQPVQHGAKQPVVAQTPHPPVRRSR